MTLRAARDGLLAFAAVAGMGGAPAHPILMGWVVVADALFRLFGMACGLCARRPGVAPGLIAMALRLAPARIVGGRGTCASLPS